MTYGAGAIAILISAFAVGCSSSSPRGAVDAGTSEDDASDDASDAASDASDDAGELTDVATGPYPSLDAPEFGPDGCSLITIACTQDIMCCSGLCNQGQCATPTHPAEAPRP